MAAQFMALNHPAALNAQAAQQAAQAAHAAFLSQTGAIPHFPGLPAASSSPSLLPGGGRSSSAEAAAAAQFMKTPGLTSLEALQRYVINSNIPSFYYSFKNKNYSQKSYNEQYSILLQVWPFGSGIL